MTTNAKRPPVEQPEGVQSATAREHIDTPERTGTPVRLILPRDLEARLARIECIVDRLARAAGID